MNHLHGSQAWCVPSSAARCANALILTEVMRYICSRSSDKDGNILTVPVSACTAEIRRARTLRRMHRNTDEEVFENFIARLEELKEKIGIKKTIQRLRHRREYFLDTLDDMCEQAFNDQCTGANPRYPLIKEIKEIYLKCY